jgi:hypothetical protein
MSALYLPTIEAEDVVVPDFIFERNIALYKERLKHETDPTTIEMLHKLLAEEEAKLADLRKLRRSKANK